MIDWHDRGPSMELTDKRKFHWREFRCNSPTILALVIVTGLLLLALGAAWPTVPGHWGVGVAKGLSGFEFAGVLVGFTALLGIGELAFRRQRKRQNVVTNPFGRRHLGIWGVVCEASNRARLGEAAADVGRDLS